MENRFQQSGEHELTSSAGSPRLEEGDIFMVDTGGEEGRAPHPDSTGPAGSEGTAPTHRPPDAEAGGSEETPSPAETPSSGDSGGGGKSGREPTKEDFKRMYETDKEGFWEYVESVAPHAYYLNTGFVEFIASLATDSEPLDYIVNTIISLPLREENIDYSLSLSAQGNLDNIKAALRKSADASRGTGVAVEMAGREKSINILSETAKTFHRMNLSIITGDLDSFSRGSTSIAPEQQEAFKHIKGAPIIMRLIDNEYLRILTEEGTVTTEASDKLHGKLSGATEKLERAVGTVQQQLIDLVKGDGADATGIPPVLAEELKGLKTWEIGWAFDAGKLLHNIGLRSAELISLSDVPSGDRAWSSIPQEHAARIMNQIGWNMKRFKMGEARGGFEFVTRAQQHFQDLRRRQGYGETGLSKIGGKEVRDFEIASMFKAAGIYTSWRNTNMIVDKMRMVIPTDLPEGLTPGDIKIKTAGEYIKAVKAARNARIKRELESETILGIKKWGRDGDPRFKKELARRITLSERDRLIATYLKNGELRPEFVSGYGVLARLRDLDPDQKDHQVPGLLKAKAEVRAAIWRRAAQENPMGLANLLTGMDFKSGHEPHFHRGGMDEFKAFTQRLKTKNNDGELTTWGTLRQKLIAVNELRLNSIKKGEPKDLESFWGIEEGQVSITKDEEALLREIQAYGKDIAKDMSAVRLPFNPFMNDVIFEDIEYTALGTSYYQRRTGDLAATMQCYENMQKIVMDPARASKEDAFKAMQAMVDALAGPNSTATAQDEVLPFLMAMLDMWEAGGQYTDPARRWLAKDNFYKMYAKADRKANSIAQKYGGVDAIAYDEFEMRDAINEALHMGLTRSGKIKGEDGYTAFIDIDDYLKKKHRVKFGGMLAAFLRDILPIFALAAIHETGKQSAQPIKN